MTLTAEEDTMLRSPDFAWFSPGGQYVVTNSMTTDHEPSSGMTVIWRKVKTALYYMLSVNAGAESVRFKGETVMMKLDTVTMKLDTGMMKLFKLVVPIEELAATTLTIDLKIQQALLPIPYPNSSKTTNVFFTGDHYLKRGFAALVRT